MAWAADGLAVAVVLDHHRVAGGAARAGGQTHVVLTIVVELPASLFARNAYDVLLKDTALPVASCGRGTDATLRLAGGPKIHV